MAESLFIPKSGVKLSAFADIFPQSEHIAKTNTKQNARAREIILFNVLFKTMLLLIKYDTKYIIPYFT